MRLYWIESESLDNAVRLNNGGDCVWGFDFTMIRRSPSADPFAGDHVRAR